MDLGHIVIRGAVRSLEVRAIAEDLPEEEVGIFMPKWRARDDKDGYSNHWEIFVSLAQKAR